jgi:hypothetical protein
MLSVHFVHRFDSERTMRKTLSFLLILSTANPALAARNPPVPSDEWDESTQLTLARAMVGEADWHEPDHVAIAFVLARRWRIQVSRASADVDEARQEPLTFQRYISLYSAPLRSTSPRTKWIRTLPWGPVDGPYSERWDRVQRLVTAWGEGRIKDPCPSAVHWGGAMDRPSKRWHPVSCGLTRNIFYSRRESASERRMASASAQ